jgi:hypothetical protein
MGTEWMMPSRLLAAAGVLLGLVAPASTASADDIKPLQPGETAYGLTLAEWGEAWFQWLHSVPSSTNPNMRTSNASAYTGVGQRKPVWFLPRRWGGNGDFAFTCPVPAGCSILLSPLSVSYTWNAGTSEDELRRNLLETMDLDQTRVLEVTVDGVPIPDVKRYRAEVPLFTANFAPGNWSNVSVSGEPFRLSAVADGFWLLLPPLPPGVHVIKSRYEVELPDGSLRRASYTHDVIVRNPDER